MIHGVGTDIVTVARIAQALERHGMRFMERILTEEERPDWRQSSQQARFLAKRFAAKEAFSKAYGTGIRDEVGFHALWVEHDQMGKPLLRYAGQLARAMADKGLVAHLSLSDEQDHVVAFVVLEHINNNHE